MVKMQGAEDEGAGSVLKYMTKPESDSNAADWPLRHADLLTVQPSWLRYFCCTGDNASKCGSRRHLRGRIALQAISLSPPAIPGRCPGLLTV